MKIPFTLAAPNVLSSALNPQATQANQKMQVFRGNQQQPQQSRSAACAMIPNQQNFTKQDERCNFSTIFSGCQIGQVHVIFKRDQAHSSWSSFLTESKIIWTFRLFSPNFRHFSRRVRRIQSWYCFHLLGSRLLADDVHKFELDLNFPNVKFDWFVRYQQGRSQKKLMTEAMSMEDLWPRQSVHGWVLFLGIKSVYNDYKQQKWKKLPRQVSRSACY